MIFFSLSVEENPIQKKLSSFPTGPFIPVTGEFAVCVG